MRKENNSIVAGPFAIVSLPGLALECLHVAMERVVFHLCDTAGNPPSLIRQAVDKQLGMVSYSNDPVHASRRATT